MKLDNGILHAHIVTAVDVKKEFSLGIILQRTKQANNPLDIQCFGGNIYLGWVQIHFGLYLPSFEE